MITGTGTKRILDFNKRSPAGTALVDMFNKRIVGQPEEMAMCPRCKVPWIKLGE